MCQVEKKYRKEIYTDWDFEQTTDCAIDYCGRPVNPYWYIGITVDGKKKRLRFCTEHGSLENQYEREYKKGF